MKLFCGILLLGSPVSAADNDLLDLMTTALGEEDLASGWVEVKSFCNNAKGSVPLKGFEAFGLQFYGTVSHREHDPRTIRVACADVNLSSADAARVSAMVEEAISVRLGIGREVKEIPTHVDATKVKSRGRLWAGPEGSVILLKTDDYFRVAQFSVVRYFDSFPLAESGEAKDFWLDHLQAIRKGKEEADAEAEWLEKHSAGVVLEQQGGGELIYPGTLTYQRRQMSLGETPPFYQHQIKVGNTAILLGQLDNRHRLERHICTVRNKDTGLRIEPMISITSPRNAGSGGFIFVADGDSISRFGVIVPLADVPAGQNRESEQWFTSVQFFEEGRFEGEVSLDAIAAMPIQKILPEWRVLMRVGALPYRPDLVPDKARIIWYRVEPSGEFNRE